MGGEICVNTTKKVCEKAVKSVGAGMKDTPNIAGGYETRPYRPNPVSIHNYCLLNPERAAETSNCYIVNPEDADETSNCYVVNPERAAGTSNCYVVNPKRADETSD